MRSPTNEDVVLQSGRRAHSLFDNHDVAGRVCSAELDPDVFHKEIPDFSSEEAGDLVPAVGCLGFCTRRPASDLKDEACGRAMREQASFAVGNSAFGGANSAAPAQHDTLRLDQARFWRDRSYE